MIECPNLELHFSGPLPYQCPIGSRRQFILAGAPHGVFPIGPDPNTSSGLNLLELRPTIECPTIELGWVSHVHIVSVTTYEPNCDCANQMYLGRVCLISLVGRGSTGQPAVPPGPHQWPRSSYGTECPSVGQNTQASGSGLRSQSGYHHDQGHC